VPRSSSCSLPATRNGCAGTPHTGSSGCVVESYPPSDEDGTMNSAVDYTIYSGLRALPFNNVPDPRFYVPCSQHDAVHRWLSYGIQTRKGIPLLTGDIGCGKTLLSRRLIVGLPPAQYNVALVANPALSPSELLDEILSQFGIDLVQSNAGRLRTFNDRLQSNAQRGISSVRSWMKPKRLKSSKDLRISVC